MSENNYKNFVLFFVLHIHCVIWYTAIYSIGHIFVCYVLVILKTFCGHYYSFFYVDGNWYPVSYHKSIIEEVLWQAQNDE